jgi:hypothetical protein
MAPTRRAFAQTIMNSGRSFLKHVAPELLRLQILLPEERQT